MATSEPQTTETPSQTEDQEQTSTTTTSSHPKPIPGPRATRLAQLYDQALDRTLSKLAYPNLAQCYPTIASRAEPMLQQVRAQIVDRLGEKCRKEFDDILEGRGVVGRLNELEGLIGEAAERKGEGEEAGTA